MPHYTNSILIRAALDEVFDYATTPDFWPDYHFVSKKVAPLLHHPMNLGDPEVVETTQVLGIDQKIHWKAILVEKPFLFIMNGVSHDFGGGNAQIIYTLSDFNGLTFFQRDFKYQENNFFTNALDHLVLTKFVAEDGKKSLENMKRILETKK